MRTALPDLPRGLVDTAFALLALLGLWLVDVTFGDAFWGYALLCWFVFHIASEIFQDRRSRETTDAATQLPRGPAPPVAAVPSEPGPSPCEEPGRSANQQDTADGATADAPETTASSGLQRFDGLLRQHSIPHAPDLENAIAVEMSKLGEDYDNPAQPDVVRLAFYGAVLGDDGVLDAAIAYYERLDFHCYSKLIGGGFDRDDLGAPPSPGTSAWRVANLIRDVLGDVNPELRDEAVRAVERWSRAHGGPPDP